MLIIMLIIALAVIIAVAVVLIVVLAGGKNKNSIGSNNGSMYNRGGIDVRNQNTGEMKGVFFEGAPVDQQTYIVTKDQQKIIAEASARNTTLSFVNLVTGQNFSTVLKDSVYIGRCADPSNPGKLVFPEDDKMSKNHCVIIQFNGGVYVQDLKSTNHTYVNDVMIEDTAILPSGSVLRVGRTMLQVIY